MSNDNKRTYDWFKNIVLNEDSNDVPKVASGVLTIARDTGKILLQRRSSSVSQPNTYGCPGGHMQWGEKPKEAAYREFAEETGYELKSHLIDLHTEKSKDLTYHTYLASVPNEIKSFDPPEEWADETDWFEWFYLDIIKNMNDLHPGLEKLIKNKSDRIRKVLKTYMLRVD